MFSLARVVLAALLPCMIALTLMNSAGADDFADQFESSVAGSAAEVEYAPPEKFFDAQADSTARLTLFLQLANEFIEQRPYSPLAPRAALDGLNAAVVLQNSHAILKMQQRLLFDFSTSFQAQVAARQVQDLNAAKSILKSVWITPGQIYDTPFSRRFIRAADLLFKRFGLELLDDPDVTMYLALALRDHRNYPLQQAIEKRLVRFKSGSRQCLQLLTDTDRSRPDLIAALMQVRDAHPDEVLFIEKPLAFLLQRCTDEERSAPDLQELRMMLEWNSGGIAVARESAENLLASNPQPKYQFAKAYLALVASDTSTALPVLQELIQEKTQPDWSNVAATVLEFTRTSSDQKKLIAEIVRLLQTLKNMQSDVQECHFEYSPLKGTVIAGYLGMDLQKKIWTAQLRRNGEPKLLFEVTADHTRYYLTGDTAITRLAKASVVPMVDVKVEPGTTGWMHVNYDFKLGNHLETKVSNLQQILGTVAAVPSKDLAEYMRKSCEKDHLLPGRVTAHGARTEFKWLRCDPLEPKVYETTLIADLEAGQISFNHPELGQTVLRFGTSDRFQLNGPPWPELPEQVKGANDARWMIGGLAVFVELLQPDEEHIIGDAADDDMTPPK